MGENNAMLQAMSYSEGKFTEQSFKFLVDICSNLKEHSGTTCIGDPDAEKDALKKITLLSKIATKFFTPQAYL